MALALVRLAADPYRVRLPVIPVALKVRRGYAIAALAVGLSGCVSSRPLPRTDAPPEAQTAYFTLHSDPWINLHHFLYAWAQEDAGIVTDRPRVAERDRLTELAPAERDVWIEVLRVYRDSILDGAGYRASLTQLKDQIARDEPTDEVLIPTLARAMPIYHERWWPTTEQRTAGGSRTSSLDYRGTRNASSSSRVACSRRIGLQRHGESTYRHMPLDSATRLAMGTSSSTRRIHRIKNSLASS